MNRYECLYVIQPNAEEETVKSLVERFSSLIVQEDGKVENVDEWGKRRLAYPIDDFKEGYYVLMEFSAASAVPQELERNLKIVDDVIRYLTVRLDDKKAV